MFIACFNPLYSVYYISCSIPTTFFVYFYVKVRYVDSLSSKSSAYFEFFVQEMMIITDSSLAVSFDFLQLGRRLVFRNLFKHVTLEIDMIMPQWRLGYDNLEVG